MSQELRATLYCHTEFLGGKQVDLILVPDSVAHADQDRYLQLVRAYKQVPLILLRSADNGAYTRVYSDLPELKTEAILSLSAGSLEFGSEHYYICDDEEGSPTWPPSKQN